jgi:hypothetical protein
MRSSSAAADTAWARPTTWRASTGWARSRCWKKAGSAAATPAATPPSSAPTTCSMRAPRSTTMRCKLWETLSQTLNYNVMFSPRGVMMLAHTVHDVQVIKRHVHANRANGVDNQWLSARAGEGVLPAAEHRRHPLPGAGCRAAAPRRHRAPRCRGLGLCARRRCAGRRHHRELRGHWHPAQRAGAVQAVETTRGLIRTPKIGVWRPATPASS